MRTNLTLNYIDIFYDITELLVAHSNLSSWYDPQLFSSLFESKEVLGKKSALLHVSFLLAMSIFSQIQYSWAMLNNKIQVIQWVH